MQSTCRAVPTRLILACALVAVGTSAQAQTAPYAFNGSDTLELVVKDAIVAAGLSASLSYAGGGSSTGENAVIANTQSIAPMSRNLKTSVVGTGLGKFDANSVFNVVGLDAAVVVTARSTSGAVKQLFLPTYTDSGFNTKRANPNVTAGNAATYTNQLEVILAGVDGSGSTLACAHPARLAALQKLANDENTATGWVSRFLRRDDNSGTTDTFKDKVRVDRFCNGRAVGVNGTNKTNPNLNNQDLDPIRIGCRMPDVIPGTTTLRPETACTNLSVSPAVACSWTANYTGTTPNCDLYAPPGAPNACACTQGLIVALSGGDDPTAGATFNDVTTTIGNRVTVDGDFATFGYAGRESIYASVNNATAPAIAGYTYSDTSVRGDDYLLSRRLYLARSSGATDAAAGTNGALKKAAEDSLFNYMTADGTSISGYLGACGIKQIVKNHGFLSCTQDPCSGAYPLGDPTNICEKPFYAAPASITAALPGSGSGGPAWNYLTAVTCTATDVCVSNGKLCTAQAVSGTCDLPTRPAGYACVQNSDCVSGTTCVFNAANFAVATCQ